MSRTALTTGSTSQDGPYLTEGDWEKYVEVDARFRRATEIRELWGDASKARSKLGRTPATAFATIVETIVRADLEGPANPAVPR